MTADNQHIINEAIDSMNSPIRKCGFSARCVRLFGYVCAAFRLGICGFSASGYIQKTQLSH